MICSLWLCHAAEALSQEVPDSLVSVYDSIQDTRFMRFGGKTEARMQRMEKAQQGVSLSVDSARTQLSETRDSVEQLRAWQSIQDQRLDSLEHELHTAEAAMAAYREGIRRNMRLATAVFLALLLASTGLLLMLHVRIRRRLEGQRKKQKKIHKALAVDLKDQEAQFYQAIGAQDRRFNRKFRALKKKVKKLGREPGKK